MPYGKKYVHILDGNLYLLYRLAPPGRPPLGATVSCSEARLEVTSTDDLKENMIKEFIKLEEEYVIRNRELTKDENIERIINNMTKDEYLISIKYYTIINKLMKKYKNEEEYNNWKKEYLKNI